MSIRQKWVKNLVKFLGSKNSFKNIVKVLKMIRKAFFSKMGKNLSITKKWVKHSVKFSCSEKIFKNIVKVLKRKKSVFLQKYVKM